MTTGGELSEALGLSGGKPVDEPAVQSLALRLVIRIGVVVFLLGWCFSIVRPFLGMVIWAIIIAVAAYRPFPLTAAALRWQRPHRGTDLRHPGACRHSAAHGAPRRHPFRRHSHPRRRPRRWIADNRRTARDRPDLAGHWRADRSVVDPGIDQSPRGTGRARSAAHGDRPVVLGLRRQSHAGPAAVRDRDLHRRRPCS